MILLSGPSKAGFTTAGGQASNVYYRIANSPYELTVITFIDIIIILIRNQNKCHPEMSHAWSLLSLYLVLLCADYCKVAGRHHVCGLEITIHGICSLNGRTSYRRISRSLEAVRLGLVFFNRSEIWQAHRQQRCRDACQISERYNHYNTQSRSFDTLRDLPVKRLTA